MASVEDLLDQIKQALQSANPRQACLLAEQARALDSADPRLILLQGVALRRSDQWIEAIPLLEHMVEEAPTLALARHELALSYQAVGRLRDAVVALETLMPVPSTLALHWSPTGRCGSLWKRPCSIGQVIGKTYPIQLLLMRLVGFTCRSIKRTTS